jgi:periplasmic divalent cation tolerance protein
MPRLVVVRTTMPDEASARRLAQRLIDGRLAACAHVQPVFSTYLWKGTRHGETEWFVEARTRILREGALRRALREGHPYEVPVVESWWTAVDADYAAWAKAQTK